MYIEKSVNNRSAEHSSTVEETARRGRNVGGAQ